VATCGWCQGKRRGLIDAAHDKLINASFDRRGKSRRSTIALLGSSSGRFKSSLEALKAEAITGLGREKLVAMQTAVDLKFLRSDPGFKTVVADARRRATTASKPE
jgi:hypothetical protein